MTATGDLKSEAKTFHGTLPGKLTVTWKQESRGTLLTREVCHTTLMGPEPKTMFLQQRAHIII